MNIQHTRGTFEWIESDSYRNSGWLAIGSLVGSTIEILLVL